MDYLPKVRIDLVVADQNAELVVNIINESASTGKIGDSNIFISDIKEAVHSHTEEKEKITV
jgi:nitrogen regulatory protein P-II 1